MARDVLLLYARRGFGRSRLARGYISWLADRLVSRPIFATLQLPAGITLRPAPAGLWRASIPCFLAAGSYFCRDGAVFAAELPPRNRRGLHDFLFALKATASFRTTYKGGPLQPFESAASAGVGKMAIRAPARLGGFVRDLTKWERRFSRFGRKTETAVGWSLNRPKPSSDWAHLGPALIRI